MTTGQETHSDRQRREAASVLSEIIEAGGVVNIRHDRNGPRLAIRFDMIEGPAAVRLFIAYRTARASHPEALDAAARDMLARSFPTP